MRRIIKIAILVFILTSSFQAISQDLSYMINNATRKITDFKGIIEFSKIYTYDLDFEQWGDEMDNKIKISVSVNNVGKGRMSVIMDNNLKTKVVTVINAVYLYTYKNDSKSSYMELQCLTDDSIHKNYYIDIDENKRITKFWFVQDENKNTRTYFLK